MFLVQDKHGRLRALARGLDVPVPFALGEFLRSVGLQRGRPIRTATFTGAGPGVPCGLWVRARDADFIYCAAETSPYHRKQIVVHEVAHMLLGHGEAAEVLGCGFPAGRIGEPGGYFNGRGAGGYTSEEEQEAEMLASFILDKAAAGPGPAPAHGPATGALMIVLDQAWGRGRESVVRASLPARQVTASAQPRGPRRCRGRLAGTCGGAGHG